MKNFTKLFFVIVLAGVSVSALAQTPKFAHINFQELVILMPEYDSATVKFDTFASELADQISSMEKELQDKYTVYQQKNATWPASVLEDKQKEIQSLGQRLEEFRRTAQQDSQVKQQELMLPILEKARATITTIAKRENIIYVFDVSAGALSYFDEQQSIDLLPIVKKDLNITKELPRATR
jgi:outer membrane protein